MFEESAVSSLGEISVVPESSPSTVVVGSEPVVPVVASVSSSAGGMYTGGRKQAVEDAVRERMMMLRNVI